MNNKRLVLDAEIQKGWAGAASHVVRLERTSGKELRLGVDIPRMPSQFLKLCLRLRVSSSLSILYNFGQCFNMQELLHMLLDTNELPGKA